MKQSKTNTVWLPEPRILTLIVMIAGVMGLTFAALLESWLSGMAVGLVFAGGIYLFVVVNARRAAKTLAQHHSGKHRGRL